LLLGVQANREEALGVKFQQLGTNIAKFLFALGAAAPTAAPFSLF
jgi:hypothetical protein